MKDPNKNDSEPSPPPRLLVSPVVAVAAMAESRTSEAVRQLFCGGCAGAVAKTVTAPLSRLTILFQVHSMVTTKGHRPKFAMSLNGGFQKIVERGGLAALWRGNMTSVLHRFPYSAINFYVYENALDILSSGQGDTPRQEEPAAETQRQLVRRMTKIVMPRTPTENDATRQQHQPPKRIQRAQRDETPAWKKFIAGALAGTAACCACYPLDLVRTRLTTELEGHEHYRGIVDAFTKIAKTEGLAGFYSGIVPTLLVAVPNFAISYTVYGTLKEYTLDDELFINFRRIDADSGEPKLGFLLTLLCGASSGALATLVTFPMDTIRRRMQIQSLHVPDPKQQLTSRQLFSSLIHKEGLSSLYRGLTPELLKVIPMVGTMFWVYEWSKDLLNVGQRPRGR
mmetsp:Transcript_1761/g.3728  ORF Transcript_1761/g.3728 Transcript_1761/m.3728 type:complete len:396 (-) Transcript_1761:1181-2368(-)